MRRRSEQKLRRQNFKSKVADAEQMLCFLVLVLLRVLPVYTNDATTQAQAQTQVKGTISFLTRELRMRNSSYCELWGNVSLDRCAVSTMQIRYACGLLLNCCPSLIKISCFKGLN